ncbi:Prefoldin beta-like - like 5 [Theobroma cacao]|nr:Prefoldin beta-like - like 5 [Theobroma cacao]
MEKIKLKKKKGKTPKRPLRFSPPFCLPLSVAAAIATEKFEVREHSQSARAWKNKAVAASSKKKKKETMNIAKNHQVKKKYTIQLGENELVLKELDLLNEDANVYKLIGPVLVKQDLAEANANVRKRIEYISAELKRLDASLQDLEEKQYSKREAILKVQQRIQSHQAGKAKA